MNPGGIEEAGKTARSIVDVFRTEPLSLALILINLTLLWIFWYVIKTATEVRHDEMDRVFAAQAKTNELLAKCYIPEK